MIEYHLKVHRDGESFWGEFPDLAGCFTDGATREELTGNAREALTGWITSVVERGSSLGGKSKKIPKPAFRGRGSIPVALPLAMGVALQLRWIRESRHLSQQEVARRLSISYQAYQRFEHPAKANPNLKTLEKLSNIYQVPPEKLLSGPLAY
ncbi:MAG: type II toxin-antitoxin system HicB family antitoxin [Candidatus Marinimicrobia bacterium]|nr:type II toxin-antitoxin system HicB family antitoxin [Candidatus Neomarinimicrobiota bacterium]